MNSESSAAGFLTEVIQNLGGYIRDDSPKECMAESIAVDATSILEELPPEEQQTLLTEFRTELRQAASSYAVPSVMEDVNTAIRLIEQWLIDPSGYHETTDRLMSEVIDEVFDENE